MIKRRITFIGFIVIITGVLKKKVKQADRATIKGFERKKVIGKIINNKEYLPCLLLGKYADTFRDILNGFYESYNNPYKIRELDIEDKEAVSERKDMYFKVRSSDVYTVINLDKNNSSRIQSRILKFIEECGDNVPIILHKSYDKIIPPLKSRMASIFKEHEEILTEEFSFDSIDECIKKIDYKNKYNLNPFFRLILPNPK